MVVREPLEKSDPTIAWLSSMLTVWLLSGFMLPNTIFKYVSPLASLDLEWLCSGSAIIASVGVVVVVAACVFLRPAASESSYPLWAITSVFGSLYAVQAVLLVHKDKAGSADCLAAALEFYAGLFGARLCGKPSLLASAVCVVCSAQALFTIAYYVQGTNSMTSGLVHRAGGTFGGPDYIYPIMLFALPLAAVLATEARAWTRLFWEACALVTFVALLLTWYRGGLLGLAIGGSWMAFRLISNKRLAVVAAAILFGLFAVSLQVRCNGPVNELSSNRSLTGRSTLWCAGWNAFLRHPITGVGVAELHLPVTDSRGNLSDYRQPQNIEIFWLAEMGVFGGLLLLLFVWQIARVVQASGTPIATGIGGAWLALLIAGQTDTSFGTIDRVSSFALLGALLGASVMLPGYSRRFSALRDDSTTSPIDRLPISDTES